MMNTSDETSKASCLDWSTGKSSVMSPGLQCSILFNPDFKQRCSALYTDRGHAALAARDYDKAIPLYSAAIDLDSANDIIFANRSTAKLEKKLWEEALLDAEEVRRNLSFASQGSSWRYIGDQTQPFVLSWVQVEARSASWVTTL